MPHTQLTKRIEAAIATNYCATTRQLLQELLIYINSPYDISWTKKKYKLSPAEFRVLEMMVDGLSPSRIAEKTGNSVSTVRVHKRNLYSKMRVSDMSELMSLLLKHRIS